MSFECPRLYYSTNSGWSCIIALVFAITLVATPRVDATDCSGTAIEQEQVNILNGVKTCHINDSDDSVDMDAHAEDYDDPGTLCPECQSGDRIDLDGTEWDIQYGTLAKMKGATNSWTAGNTTGSFTLTVTFDDKDDGDACDDDTKQVQKTLKAFKVGVRLTTNDGNLLEFWEDSDPSSANTSVTKYLSVFDIVNDNYPSNPKSDSENTTATWTLITEPSGVNMDGNIKAWAHASGGYSDEPGITGEVRGETWDNDFLDSGNTSVGISISAGLVSFSISQTVEDDDAVGLLSSGAGFGSEVHADKKVEMELVSSTPSGPTQTNLIDHYPDDGSIIGKEGTSKQAEWEIRHKLKRYLEGSGDDAGVESWIEMEAKWGVTTNTPAYIP